MKREIGMALAAALTIGMTATPYTNGGGYSLPAGAGVSGRKGERANKKAKNKLAEKSRRKNRSKK